MLGVNLTPMNLAMRSIKAAFTTDSLFAGGEQGVLYDPSDLSTLFQDSAGLIPVTGVEQPVGKMLDKSGRGNHATQAVPTSRPILRNRYNLLLKTEEFNDGAVWLKETSNTTANPAVTANYALDPLGGSTAARVQLTVPGDGSYAVVRDVGLPVNLPALSPMRASIWVKANSPTNVGKGVNFYTYNETVTAYAVGMGSAILTDTWQRFESTQTFNSSSTSVEFAIGKARSTQGGFTNAQTATDFLIWGASLVSEDQAHLPYQRVSTTTDYDSTFSKFPLYLACDGAVTGMVTANIDFTGTDEVTAFAAVRKQKDTALGVLVELGANTATANSSFALLAPHSANNETFAFRSRGTTLVTLSATGFKSPVTSVLCAKAKIASDVITLRADGADVAQVNSDQGTGNYGNYPLYLFRRGGTTLPFIGNFYGLLIRGKLCDAIQTRSGERYLAARAKHTLS